MSLSSCGSEFRQLSRAVNHAVKMQETFINFGFKQNHDLMDVFTDNQPALRNMIQPADSSGKTQTRREVLSFCSGLSGEGNQITLLGNRTYAGGYSDKVIGKYYTQLFEDSAS